VRPPLRQGRLLLYASVFLFTCGESALHLLVPPYLSVERSLGPGAIGALVGAFGLASLAVRIPSGALYPVLGGGTLLATGGLVSALAMAAVPTVDGVAPIAALLAVNGVGFALATTAQLAVLVASTHSRRDLAATMGWYAGCVGLGHMVAGASAGLVADRVSFDAGFAAFAALPAVAACLALLARRPPDAARPPHPPAAARSALRSLPAAAWGGVAVMFTINALNGAVTTFYPVLALAAGLSLTQIGILASCRSWASATVRFASGGLFRKLRPDGLTGPLLLVGAGAVVLVPSTASSFLLTLPLFLAAGVSRGLLRVTGSTDAFGAGLDPRRVAMTAAVLLGGLDLGRVAGPVVAGGIAEATSIATMFRVLPGALLAVWLALELRARRSPASRAVSGEA
jgi:predicted MFS family arabinose efflux permease